jgi:hypothetical protein
MRAAASGTLLGLAVVLLGACASNAPKSVESSAGVEAKAAPAAVSPTAVNETAPDPGPSYRRIVRDGQEYFCRRQVVTGSRLKPKETCLTAAQIEEQRLRSQDFLRSAPGASVDTTTAGGSSSAPSFGY